MSVLDVLYVRFMSSVFERLPISFKMTIHNQNIGDDTQQLTTAATTATNKGFFNFSCFSNQSCMEYADEGGFASPVASQNSYVALDHAVSASDTVHLRTRKPQWNREINHWVHNFGGRVKIPSNKNFIVTECSGDASSAPPLFSVSGAGTGSAPRITSAAETSQEDRVVIRHGKVT